MTNVTAIMERVAALKELAPRTADHLPQLSNAETESLCVRIVELTKERDDYILKQQTWENANDELRSEHIRLSRENQELRRRVHSQPVDCEFSDSGRHECQHCDAVGFASDAATDGTAK
jgi:hypothetical protein